MPGHATDEHDEHFEHLRRRVLLLHRGAVEAAERDADGDAGNAAAGNAADGDAADGDAEPEPRPGADRREQLVQAVVELVEATDAMLAFEDRLPVLRDLPARASSVQAVRASALAVLLGAVLLGLGIWRQILAVWWFPGMLIMLPAAVRMALFTVAPAAGRHRRQRYLAAVSGAAALLTAPAAAVFGWLPGASCLLVLAGALAALLEVRWGRG